MKDEAVVRGYPRWAWVHGLLWGGLWLVPMLGCSLFNYTPREIPPKLSVYYWLTGLFTKRSKTWSEIHVEVRSGSGQSWQLVDTALYDPLMIWGIGNRLQRVVVESSYNKERGKRIRDRTAQWLAEKHRKLYPQSKPLSEVRFVGVYWKVGESEWMTHPPGSWKKLSPWLVREGAEVRVISTHEVGGGPPMGVAQPKAMLEPAGGWTDVTLKEAVAAGRAPVKLDASTRSKLTAKGLTMVWQLSGLRELTLQGRALDAEALRGLGRLGKLERLDLTEAQVVGGWAEVVGGLGELRTLILKEAKMELGTGEAKALVGLKKLRLLDLTRLPGVTELLKRTGDWTQLDELILRGCSGLENGLVGWQVHPVLRKLDLTDTGITNAGLEPLIRQPRLSLIKLDGTKVTDGLRWWCGRMVQLQGLSVVNTGLGEEEVEALRRVPHLRHLRSEGTQWVKLPGRP